ncbi:hypothetical protein VE01_04778 [Pseudogymnoascus verrucosus]|uniref:Uncharacterized protein n=1 Tax=Pseudogymnoascus verrucosus TaxID=342668 RepID=A0A1B8GMJ7_9PEZI|nr:uncharacterized protein VE01_04778 [Pseudogymnoascus verrucosus]OBT97062.1 hypothetical protein VE01_04778 [Pseudogymnoascus verrucosus]
MVAQFWADDTVKYLVPCRFPTPSSHRWPSLAHTAYFSIPLGNLGAPAAPAAAASAAAQPVSVAWTPFGSWLLQPSRYRVVWPFPLVLATNNGPAPAGMPAPAVACPASCVAAAATVTVTSPPVTTTTTTTLSGPLPTEIANGGAFSAGGNLPKPDPVFDEQGNWSCCIGPFSGGSGVGCT